MYLNVVRVLSRRDRLWGFSPRAVLQSDIGAGTRG